MPCNFHLRALAGEGQAGDPGRRRHPDGAQHDRDLGRDHDGHAGDARLAGQPRADRRLASSSSSTRTMFDAVIAISGCDKTIPGTVMALCRLDIPSVMLYGGSILPGHLHGERVTIQEVFEAVGAHAAGKITDERADRDRGRRLARRRRLRRPVHRQHDGDGVRGARHLAGRASAWSRRSTPTRPTVAERAGALVMDILKRDLRPSDIITRESLENAIAAIAASGGSTNGVLHLLAIATGDGHRAAHRRLRPHQRAHAAASATSSPAAGTWPPTSTRPAACRC